MLQYPSHRPVPRMVLASTLEKLSDNPRYLAAVLLDSSRPWNDRLDELHDAGIPVSKTRARNLASCMRRFGVRTSGGIVQNANAYANGEEPKSALQSDTDLVDAAGWNPDRWSLAGRQSGYMTMPDGHRQRVALVAHEPDVDMRAIAELLVSPIPRFEPSVSVEARTGSYCLCLADLQTGKATEARGGTSQLVARVRSIIRQAVAQAERLRPEEIVVFELGDICEGNANSTSQSQLAANDIAQAEQLQVCARLLLEAIIALAPFAPRLKVVSVRSNHGEERKNGQSIGRGDFGIMTARIIGEAISMIPGPLSERIGNRRAGHRQRIENRRVPRTLCEKRKQNPIVGRAAGRRNTADRVYRRAARATWTLPPSAYRSIARPHDHRLPEPGERLHVGGTHVRRILGTGSVVALHQRRPTRRHPTAHTSRRHGRRPA